MTALPTSRSIAMHESHHAAALLMAGMVPKCVRTDYPTPNEAGSMEIDWGEDGVDPAKAKHVLIAVLLGGMTNGFQGWSSWPLDPSGAPDGSRRDAEQARCLAEYLGLDRVGWLQVLWQANRLAKQSRFRRLAVLIADELERVEVLSAQDLKNLLDKERT
jgi:hypothetical protein